MNKANSDAAFQARVIVYITTVILLAFMVFADPFEYLCNEPGIRCPGCGFKTGLYDLLSLDFERAMENNAASVVIVVLSVFAAIDVIVGIVRGRLSCRKTTSRFE